MNNQLSIAIKIPTFNVQATILQTIRSLLNQTYQNFIIYIYDNCSTDSTLAILRELNDGRIVIATADENLGWKWNFDRCLKNEGHPLTLFAHADDIYHPYFIETNATLLSEYKNVSLLFSKGSYFSDIGEISNSFYAAKQPPVVSVYDSYNELLKELAMRGNFIFCPSAFGWSEIFYSVIHEFRETDFGGSADLDAWLRVAKNHAIAVIESPTIFYYRISANQISEQDRGLKAGSVFVKCMSAHLKSVPVDKSSYQKDVTYLIRWHELFHAVVSDIKCSISTSDMRINSRFAYNITELIKLRGIPVRRNLMLAALIFLVEVATLLPRELQKKFVMMLLRSSR
ncbi:Glyco_tranf_GTA_type domain containing protein [Methylophilaceae bacterium]